MPPDTVVQEDEIEGWAGGGGGGGGEGGGAPSRRRPSHNPRLALRSAPFVEDGGPDGRLWPPYRSQREELLGKTTSKKRRRGGKPGPLPLGTRQRRRLGSALESLS